VKQRGDTAFFRSKVRFEIRGKVQERHSSLQEGIWTAAACPVCLYRYKLAWGAEGSLQV